MSESDIIRCEHPGPAGSTCVRPYGHADEEGHHYAMSLDMPPDIGRMIDSLAEDLERQIGRAKRAERWHRISMCFFWGGFLMYIGLIIAKSMGRILI